MTSIVADLIVLIVAIAGLIYKINFGQEVLLPVWIIIVLIGDVKKYNSQKREENNYAQDTDL